MEQKTPKKIEFGIADAFIVILLCFCGVFKRFWILQEPKSPVFEEGMIFESFGLYQSKKYFVSRNSQLVNILMFHYLSFATYNGEYNNFITNDDAKYTSMHYISLRTLSAGISVSIIPLSYILGILSGLSRFTSFFYGLYILIDNTLDFQEVHSIYCSLSHLCVIFSQILFYLYDYRNKMRFPWAFLLVTLLAVLFDQNNFLIIICMVISRRVFLFFLFSLLFSLLIQNHVHIHMCGSQKDFISPYLLNHSEKFQIHIQNFTQPSLGATLESAFVTYWQNSLTRFSLYPKNILLLISLSATCILTIHYILSGSFPMFLIQSLLSQISLSHPNSSHNIISFNYLSLIHLLSLLPNSFNSSIFLIMIVQMEIL